MPPYLRYLRIGWTVFYVIVAVLLVLLWVRSYWYSDTISNPNNLLTSDLGDVRFHHDSRSSGPKGWHLSGYEQSPATADSVRNRPWISSRFGWNRWQTQFAVQVPHWLPVYICGIFAVLPQVNRLQTRFSLRTLLIATTLVAMVLGLIVWLG